MAGTLAAFLNYEEEAMYQGRQGNKAEEAWVPNAMEHHNCSGVTLFQSSFA